MNCTAGAKDSQTLLRIIHQRRQNMENYLQEKWLETGIDNDFMFHCVMSKHPELCLELLQI